MPDHLSIEDGFISQKFKFFLSGPDGCAIVAAIEEQYQCFIEIVNDSLKITPKHQNADVTSIENILRETWQKQNDRLVIKAAALNASCTHMCQAILPRAYSAVAILFSDDIRRRSRCDDVLNEHFDGKVTIYGNETAVELARMFLIECLTDHFGPLEMEIPPVQRTTKNLNNYIGQASIPSPKRSYSFGTPPSENDIFANCDVLSPQSSTNSLPPFFDESFLSNKFDQNITIPAPIVPSSFNYPPPPIPQFSPMSFFAPPPPPPHMSPISPPRTNNVEKLRVLITKDDVNRILGNRAALKKQIEAQFNCVVSVRTDCPFQFGMIPVEIMGQNSEQCRNARDWICKTACHQYSDGSPTKSDSGISSNSSPSSLENITPEKRFPRKSAFRDQPKVLLALSPRKTPPLE
ncbi:unnamed protein product [Caenorhabditis bovis]|uniref:K Homology domain-containing protein n=1 Tax=Caenorhabditis bovis TaxID=2654633 RepID=A0A8S1F612_9PELO|nr:unnamed protein product [Caenorhabditis bovis]